MSELQSVSNQIKVFISYSRKDRGFVQGLHQQLQNAGVDTWVDWEGIPLSADWWAEIKQAIDSTDAFVFIVTPDSLNSEVCNEEIEAAVSHNKRVIPILHREPRKGDPIHPKISAHNWIFMQNEAELEANIPEMINTLNTDLDWVKAHGYNASLLLRGDDLRRAEEAVKESAEKEPEPTDLQMQYIDQSRRHAARRRRIVVTALIVGAIITFLAIFSYSESVEATRQKDIAQANEQEANTQRGLAEEARATAEVAALEAEASADEAQRQREIAEDEAERARLAEQEADAQRVIAEDEAEKARQAEVEAETQRDIATAIKEEALALRTAITGELLRQQGKLTLSTLVAIESLERTHTNEGEQLLRNLIARLPAGKYELLHESWVKDVAFSPDSTVLLTAADHGIVQLWEVETGELLQSLQIDSPLQTAVFSPAGDRVAIGDLLGNIIIWDVNTGTQNNRLAHEDTITDLEFAPDGFRLGVSSEDGYARIWNITSGGKLFETRHRGPAWGVAFSPNGKLFLTMGDDSRGLFWNLEDFSLIKTFVHNGPIFGGEFMLRLNTPDLCMKIGWLMPLLVMMVSWWRPPVPMGLLKYGCRTVVGI